MGGVRHAKELSDVVYNGLSGLGPLQTERKLSSCSRMVYCKHACSHPVARGRARLCAQGVLRCDPRLSRGRHILGTATPLPAQLAFTRSESEWRDDAHSLLVPTCLWAEEGAKDLNSEVH